MKTFFWTTIFWLFVFFGFFGYIKWFNQDLGTRFFSYIVKTEVCVQQECPDINEAISLEDWEVISLSNSNSVETKLDEIKNQIKEINEKLDIQSSNAPDAVSVSLKTTKRTNIWIFPLDWSEHKQYIMPASDDILKDTLNILFEKSAFKLKGTRLDNDGNLAITLERDFDVAFWWSAMVEQVKTSIEKTATQFPQIKKITILPEEVLQP